MTFRDDLHSTCSVSRGRFRISLRLTSDPFDFAARPKRDLLRGRGRRYRRGRDRWSRRAVVVAITIVTISEKKQAAPQPQPQCENVRNHKKTKIPNRPLDTNN